MDDGEGRELIDGLMTFATTPERIYSHLWSPSDVLIRDERAVHGPAARSAPWPVSASTPADSIPCGPEGFRHDTARFAANGCLNWRDACRYHKRCRRQPSVPCGGKLEETGKPMTKITRTTVFMSAWIVSVGLLAGGAAAQLDVGVTEGLADPVPIAVTDFNGTGDMAQLGRDIAAVVKADLEFSGLFTAVDPGAFLEDPSAIGEEGQPHFPLWRQSGAHALVTGWASRTDDDRARVSFRLFDTLAEEQLVGFAYRGSESIWRRIGHKIADAVYQRFTGETGFFDTRIVYVHEEGAQTDLRKRIAVMDYDGHNHRFLTSGDFTVLTPRFSPTVQKIAYFSYFNETIPRVYLLDLATGRREVLGDFPGMSFAPRFSPDGEKVIMSLAINGNTDIYVMDLATRTITQLTNQPAIDTSPSYSPDGSEVVFTSDRSGQTQLYIMDADGGNQRRISFDPRSGRKASYSTPVWSPRGDLIAFTKHIPEAPWAIGVMAPSGNDGGTGERLLARGDLVEGPTWSPNGRVIMFAHETYEGDNTVRTIRSVDLTGHVHREIRTQGAASDPAWSPLIR